MPGEVAPKNIALASNNAMTTIDDDTGRVSPSAPNDPSPCLAAALDAVARGWFVFPAMVDAKGRKKSHVSGKHGNGRRWGSTTDPDLLRQYWREFPNAQLGVASGSESGLFVLDVDTFDAHGKDGVGNLERLIAEHGPLPETIESITPTRGRHIWFSLSRNIRIGNSVSLVAQGVDVRGERGMIIAPPSTKPGGAGSYRWKNAPGRFNLAACPDWLLDLCRQPAIPKRIQAPSNIDPSFGFYTDRAGIAEVREMLTWIDPDAGGYHQWQSVLMALHDHFSGGSDGLSAAEDWSSRGPKLVAGEVASKWKGFTAGGGLGIGTIAKLAQEGGADLSAIARRHRPMPEARSHRVAERAKTQEDGVDKTEIVGRHLSIDGGARSLLAGRIANDQLEGSEVYYMANETDLSHDGLARELGARSWDSDARHVAAQGRWYFWDGRHWAADDCLLHMTRAREFLRSRAGELFDWAERKAGGLDQKAAQQLAAWAKTEARNLRSAKTVAALVTLARSNPSSVVAAAAFDQDPLIVGTSGGTVDLRNGQLRKARREDMVTKLTAVAPADPGTPAPIWERFLNETFDGNRDTIAFMQRAAGYALTGLNTEHKLLFLYGTGRNGKSTFLETLSWLWGNYARRAPAATFLYNANDPHPTGIAGFRGVRLVIGSELPKGKFWDESLIKDLTGGDRMSARFMRGDFFDFTPQLTLMIAGNNMPSFRAVDDAIRARVVLVRFTVTVPPEKRDRKLAEKLRAEGPAILRWAIDGALEWQRRGLDVPASVAAASDEYFADEDTLGQFLADQTRPEPGKFVQSSELHERFRLWCERQGISAWTMHTFVKELKSRGYADHRRTHERGFLGVKLI